MLTKNLLQVLKELKNQKLRTLLTLFGIIWGTVSVILLLTFGSSIKKQMSKNMHGLGEGICIIWAGKTSVNYAGFPKGRNINFNNGDAEYIREHVPIVKNISPQYTRWLSVRVKDKNQTFGVHAVWMEFKDMRNLISREGGRFINPIDMEKRRRVAFIGFSVEEKMFGKGKGLGEIIYIDGTPFTVIGVLKEKIQNSTYAGRDEDAIFIPVSTYLGIYGDKYINVIICRASDVHKTDQMKDEILTAFAKKYKFFEKDTEALSIWDTTEMDQFLDSFFLGFNIFLGISGIMTLIVGGIGMSNIMYVIVEERTLEIGIKRAVGAKKYVILLQYLFETFIIAGIGAAIGFLISQGVIAIVNQFPLEDYIGTLALNLAIAIITIVIITLITLIAGWGPAKHAANLDPAVAIKGK